jgi:hypothetical protein
VLNTHGEIVGDWLGYRDAKGFSKLLEDVGEYLYKAVGATRIPEVELDESDVVRKVEHIRVDPNGAKDLLELLGHKDAAVRDKVTEALVQKGPDVIEMVLGVLEDDYLGARIGAWAVIRELNFADLVFDPWASRSQRSDAIIGLRMQIRQQNPKTHPPASSSAPD